MNKKLTIKTEAINEALDFIYRDKDEFRRPALQGILINITKDKITVVGCDSFCLYENIYNNDEKQDEFQVILKPNFNKAIKTELDKLEISQVSDTMFVDNLGNSYNIVDAEYPIYKATIPNTEKQPAAFFMFKLNDVKLMEKFGLKAIDARSEATADYLAPFKWVLESNESQKTLVFCPIRRDWKN